MGVINTFVLINGEWTNIWDLRTLKGTVSSSVIIDYVTKTITHTDYITHGK